MSLYDLYNKTNSFNEGFEEDSFLKAIEVRCNNLIVCGDKLPFYIVDIKPHSMLNVTKLKRMLFLKLGLHCEFNLDSIVVNNISNIEPLPLRTVKEFGF